MPWFLIRLFYCNKYSFTGLSPPVLITLLSPFTNVLLDLLLSSICCLSSALLCIECDILSQNNLVNSKWTIKLTFSDHYCLKCLAPPCPSYTCTPSSSHKPIRGELISMQNNCVCVNTMLQMSICAEDKTAINQWLSAALLCIYSLGSTCFLHNHSHRPIIRSAGGRAVNQRFTLLRPISPSWWILMGTCLLLKWWTAVRSLLEFRCHPQTTPASECTRRLTEA